MEVIENFYNCTNIYYSLLLYSDQTPIDLIRELKAYDYPIVEMKDINNFDYMELKYRMFCMHIDNFNELLFYNQNNISQFTVIFCCDNISYDKVLFSLENKKPSCEENIVITKIFF